MTKKPTRSFIRDLLMDNPNGVPFPDICQAYADYAQMPLRQASKSVRDAFKGQIPFAYIDRWKAHQAHTRWMWVPVYCVVEIPEDCPKPEGDPERGRR